MILSSTLYFKNTSFIQTCIISVGNKGKWLLFKASCLHVRQVAVTCRCGTSVVRNLKFLTPFFIFLTTIINIILSTNRSYVISPCVTNTDQWLTSLLYYRAAKYSQKETSHCTSTTYTKGSCLLRSELVLNLKQNSFTNLRI